jgi:hypothetical protein
MTMKPKTRKAPAAKTATLEQRWRLREIRRLLKIALQQSDAGALGDDLLAVLVRLVNRRWTEFMEERGRS